MGEYAGFGYGGTGPDTASREVTDGVTTAGDLTFTSATAAFTSAPMFAIITGHHRQMLPLL